MEVKVESKLVNVCAMSALILLSACADDRVSQNQELAQKTSPSQVDKSADVQQQQETEKKMKNKRDPNVIDNTDSITHSPEVTKVQPQSTKTLREIQIEQGEIQKLDCDDKVKTEDGSCIIPKPRYPDEDSE